MQTVNLINVTGFDLFGNALVARSTNYVLCSGASSNEGLYDGVLSCARANDEDSHPSEFIALVLEYLEGDYVDHPAFAPAYRNEFGGFVDWPIDNAKP